MISGRNTLIQALRGLARVGPTRFPPVAPLWPLSPLPQISTETLNNRQFRSLPIPDTFLAADSTHRNVIQWYSSSLSPLTRSRRRLLGPTTTPFVSFAPFVAAFAAFVVQALPDDPMLSCAK
jgi:hypothetical protein